MFVAFHEGRSSNEEIPKDRQSGSIEVLMTRKMSIAATVRRRWAPSSGMDGDG